MTTFQEELIKIVLDKGLLALIAGGLVFYFQRALERFKARNAYFQHIAEEKVSALKDTALYYSQQVVLLKRFQLIVTNFRDSQSMEEKVKAFTDAYGAFVEHAQDHAAILMSHSVFFSPTLKDHIVTHQNRIGEFDAILQAGPPEAGKVRQAPRLLESYAEILSTVANELHVPPTG